MAWLSVDTLSRYELCIVSSESREASGAKLATAKRAGETALRGVGSTDLLSMLQVCSRCCHLLALSRVLPFCFFVSLSLPLCSLALILPSPALVSRYTLLQPRSLHGRQHIPQTRHLDPQRIQPQLRLRLPARLTAIPQRRGQRAREGVGRWWA